MKTAPSCRPSSLVLPALLALGTAWSPPVTAARPGAAVLSAVELSEAGHGRARIVLTVVGTVDRIETARLDRGRFVFDLTPVVWEGATQRVHPASGGIREYRFSQFSLDPHVTRLVVEVDEGWSCRHDPAPGGLVVECRGSQAEKRRSAAAGGPAIAVVRGVELASPIAGLDARALIDRSLGFTPRDLVHDGLPHFGSARDDWMGAPRPHKGIDIYVDRATVQAVAAGTVAGVGVGERAGGWVRIDHGGGVESVYVHVVGTRVESGDAVARGQPIAAIDGAVGNAVEPQLHFELRLDGEAVDPVPYIFALASDDLKRTITRAYERVEALVREREALIDAGSTSD